MSAPAGDFGAPGVERYSTGRIVPKASAIRRCVEAVSGAALDSLDPLIPGEERGLTGQVPLCLVGLPNNATSPINYSSDRNPNEPKRRYSIGFGSVGVSAQEAWAQARGLGQGLGWPGPKARGPIVSP